MLRYFGPSIAAVVLMLNASPVHAEDGPPQFESADPSPNQRAHRPPQEVSVTFNELLDPSSSAMSVFACGVRVDDDTSDVDGDTVSVSLARAPAGRYVVRYTVTGADDTPAERSDPTRGSHSFSLHTSRCHASDERHHPDGKRHGDVAHPLGDDHRGDADAADLAIVLGLPALIGVAGGTLLRSRSRRRRVAS